MNKFPLEYIGGRKFVLAMTVIIGGGVLLSTGHIDVHFLKEVVLMIIGFYFGVNMAAKERKEDTPDNKLMGM